MALPWGFACLAVHRKTGEWSLDAIITPMGGSPSSFDASPGADQPALFPDPIRPHLRIHAINVFVRDQDKSLRFYIDQLGFTLVGDVRFGSDQRWVAVAPPDGSAVLSLVAPKPDSKDFALIGRPTQVVFVTEDVVAKCHEWTERGVRFQYAPRLKRIRYERQAPAPGSTDRSSPREKPEPLWGGVFTHFRDPDGNTFALVSFDEESRAVEAQRRAATAKVEVERRAAQELEIAKQVQMKLFPQMLPPLATLDYSGICIQAREVGGDYYDFLDLGRERLGLVVGDISGKGIAAALLMANLQANLRSQCAVALDQPQRSLQLVNRLFYENSTDSAYTTLFFGEYDDRVRRLRYVNCGHLSGILLRHDGALERLHSTCTVLGLFEEWDCSTKECSLSSDDTLALYTDGITESFNGAGEEFGEHRLIESLRQHREKAAGVLVASIVDDVKKFSPHEQSDDITLIVAKCR
jgi:serine phosphatase RsbU (regulator of sigma subunit)/catechol 2,3-dioxygenase-like lactoylglutathione lyase family enzyme